MKLFLAAVMLGIGVLAGCTGTTPLQITTLKVAGTLDLIPQMENVRSTDGRIMFQEAGEQATPLLDSLVIEEIATTVPVAAYVQQSLNQLKLYGYQISNETAKKSTLTSKNATSIPTLLKTYTIVNTLGTQLYIAQYSLQFPESIWLLSYATDQQKHRKAFIRSVWNLTF